MNGSEQAEQLRQAGFGADEVAQWTTQQRARLSSAGFSGDEVDSWFGTPPADMTNVRNVVRSNLADQAARAGGGDLDETGQALKAADEMQQFGMAHALEVSRYAAQPEFTPAERTLIDRGAYGVNLRVQGGRPARSFDDALTAGLQMSVSGLLMSGKAPTRVLAEDAPMSSRIAANIATITGDLPFMAGGAVLGGGAGAPSGPGAAITAGAGAFGLPAGLRATLLDAYTKGEFTNFRDFWERASGIIWEEVKGELTGAATVASGGAARAVTAGAGVPLALKLAAPTVAEIGTMTAVGNALEGRVPKAQDFLDAAVLLGGMKIAGAAPDLAGRLRDVYRRTGATPQQVLEAVGKDPTVLPDLVAENRPPPAAFGPDQTAAPVLDTKAQAIAARIPRLAGLDAPGRDVETRFAHWIASDVDRALDAYTRLPDTEGGRIINTDSARELSPDYARSLESRSALSAAVHEPASWLMKELLRRKLEAPVDPERPTVLFTAGGTGSGKTTAVRNVELLRDKQVGADFIYDTNSHRAESAAKKIDAVLASGRRVNLVYVHRDALDSFTNGMLPRAEGKGRAVPLADHIETHAGMSDSIAALATKYADDARVAFYGVDNSHGPGGAVPVPVEQLVEKRYNTSVQEYESAAEEAYRSGKISARVYRGVLGRDPPGLAGGGEARGRGDGGVDQPGNRLPAAGGGPRGPPGEPPPDRVAPPEPPNGGPDEAQRAVLARISAGERARRAYTWDRFYTDMKDELWPIKRVVDELADGKPLDVGDDPYKLARLARGLSGKAQQFLELSPFKFKTYENVGKPLKAILAPVQDDLDGMRAYAVARRSVELARRGVETGVPTADARAVIAAGGKYATIFDELGQYQNHVLNYLRDSGVLSTEAVEAMREANKDYVPFFRLMDDATQGSGPGKGLTVRNPVKQIRGSERRIIDPLESIVKNTYLFTTLAERNAVGRALVDLAERSPDQELVKRVTAPARPVDVQEREVAQFLKEHGIEDAQAEAFTIFRRGVLNPADDQIAVFRDGKRELYEVPADLAAAFKATDRETVNMLTKVLAIPAKTLRAGATLTPDFMLRNVTRDSLMAAVNSNGGYIPVLDTLRGALSLARQDDEFQAWLKGGGAGATLVSMDRQYLQERLSTLADLSAVRERAWNVVRVPWTEKPRAALDAGMGGLDVVLAPLRMASEFFENATRIGEFKKELDQAGEGLSKEAAQAAAYESRNVTLDFARIGAKTRGLNMITAFWNAQVEGVDRIGRAFQDNPFRTTLRVAAYLTLPSVLLWWANHDDPRWNDIPNWERDLFWIVMTKDHVFRIPKPFELGVLFGSGPERLLDAFYDKRPEAFHEFGKSIANVLGFNVLPTVAVPVLEQVTNHSFFTDRPLIPSSLEKLLPEYQYTPYTTETTKALGQLVGSFPGMHRSQAASPMILDNYVRGWSGSMGVYAVQIADAALRKAGVLPDPVLPAQTLADMPVVKAFVVRYPSATAQSIQDFNQHYQESKMVVDTIQYLARQGDTANALKEARLDPIMLAKLDGVHEALGNAQRMVQLVYKNPNFTADEKRQLIDTAYFQMIEMAREGNSMILDLRKTLGPQLQQRSAEVKTP